MYKKSKVNVILNIRSEDHLFSKCTFFGCNHGPLRVHLTLRISILILILIKWLIYVYFLLSIDSGAATPVTNPGPGLISPPQPPRDLSFLPPTPPETAGSPSCETTYCIPWHKMPSTIQDSFSAKKWIPANKRSVMIRLIVDDMISKRHGQRPTRAQLREVAQTIIDKFPLSFQETEPFGNKPFATDGCAVLFQQLENRVENLKRDPNSRRPAVEGETPRKKKSRYSDRYGCVEWEPAIEGPEFRATLLLKKDELKNAFNTSDLQVKLQTSRSCLSVCPSRADITHYSALTSL